MRNIEGSCHCGVVSYRTISETPYPVLDCYCTVCRKTAGGSGSAILVAARASALDVDGWPNVTTFNARLRKATGSKETEISPATRTFCRCCGTALWMRNPARRPELVLLFASSIDSDLPLPPERLKIMTQFAAGWTDYAQPGIEIRCFAEYADESIVDWHQRKGLYEAP